MSLLIIIFSVILGIGGIIFLVWRIKSKKTYLTFFLETGIPTYMSYKKSIKEKNRYFMTKNNEVINLKKHPELLRFRDPRTNKDYLVKPWKREENLYLKEGETKVVVFEILNYQGDNIAAIPCLRTAESIIREKSNDPLMQYRDTFLGVSWDGGYKIVKSEYLMGTVEYEGV